MNVRVKYLGQRGDSLKAYKTRGMRGGPYDFSKGVCEVDEKDADILLRDSPRAFEIAPKAEKPVKKDEGDKP